MFIKTSDTCTDRHTKKQIQTHRDALVSSLSSIMPKAPTGLTISTKSGVVFTLLRTSLNASLSSIMKSSLMLMETAALVSPTPNVTLKAPES